MDDAYDTIEKLQNMLTQGKVVRVPIVDNSEKLKEERRKRNVVVLRCLSRIRRNKLFAYAFRKWYMAVSTQQQQQQQQSGRRSDEDESLIWKQKYEETNKKLDTLQKKFDEVMPILIAAAERAAVAASSPQRKEEDESEEEQNRVKEAKEETMKKFNTAVNSKSCVVM